MGIVELIANSGKGGQTMPMRQLQMAQGEQVRQQTQIDRQEAQDESKNRELVFEKQRQLDEIGRSSTSTEQWMKGLMDGGYQKEYQQAQDMANKISEQTQRIETSKRKGAQEESVFLSQLLTDVKDLAGQTKALELFDKRYPDSDVDEMVDRKVYSPELISMYRYSALSASESLRLLESQQRQEKNVSDAELKDRELDIKSRQADTKASGGGEKPGIYNYIDENGKDKKISHSNLLSEYKTEFEKLDDFTLDVIGKINPEAAAQARAKSRKSKPFGQWADETYGIKLHASQQNIEENEPEVDHDVAMSQAQQIAIEKNIDFQSAVDGLRDDPEKASEFDEIFGQGAADAVLKAGNQ